MNDVERDMLVKAKNSLLLENIKILCLRNQTSIPKLEKELGYGNGSISSWKKAKKVASRERVQEIADYFNVPIQSLITENGVTFGNAPDISDNFVTFPVIGEVAAGYDHIAYEDWSGDSIDIPRSWLRGRPATDYFVLRVKGDSMYPDYQDGDHVIILRQSTMDRSGQVGVVRYGDENATLKRIEYLSGENWMTLRPINPQYPPVTIRDEALEHCTVFGVAKYVVRELQQ